jgi:hypothetical protein
LPQVQTLPVGAVDTFQLPNSRVTVTMKRRAGGRDKAEALQATLGEGYNPRHAYTRYLCYMAASLIVSWDATEDDGNGSQVPMPVSPQTLALMEDEEDYQKIIEEAAHRVSLREAVNPDGERNFETSSTPSTPETSSPTPESSPTS